MSTFLSPTHPETCRAAKGKPPQRQPPVPSLDLPHAVPGIPYDENTVDHLATDRSLLAGAFSFKDTLSLDNYIEQKIDLLLDWLKDWENGDDLDVRGEIITTRLLRLSRYPEFREIAFCPCRPSAVRFRLMPDKLHFFGEIRTLWHIAGDCPGLGPGEEQHRPGCKLDLVTTLHTWSLMRLFACGVHVVPRCLRVSWGFCRPY
ncbi:uncharacterized protein BJX67DRAFT_384686 [Aspergillus lucknowensis]|uniref:Uncharacterized protein n=1 Tax=Aspergillus lucknowensis TaxID=176173 RepID=A0ABR4LJ00_9EURO